MTPRSAALVLVFAIAAAGAVAAAQVAPASEPAPAPAPATDEVATTLTGVRPRVERDDPARPQRLEAQLAELEAQLAAMRAFGHEEEWIAAARERYEAWCAENPDPGFVAIGDWVVTTALLRAVSLARPPPPPEKRAPKEDGTIGMLLALADLDRQLAARGIDFLVVTVPSKLGTYPEILLPGLDPAGFAGMGSCIPQLLVEAAREGVESLSLTGEFAAARTPADPAREDLLFLKSDPHWTVRGAELCARKVAERIRRYPWFRAGPHGPGRGYRVEERAVPYTAGSELAAKGSRDETMRGRVLRTRDQPFTDALDPKSPILVFGDSFARVHNEQGGDFCSQLCRFTGWKIDCLFTTAGGQRQTRQKLARRTAEQWEGKKLAIWLVPDQLLYAPLRVEPVELFAADGG